MRPGRRRPAGGGGVWKGGGASPREGLANETETSTNVYRKDGLALQGCAGSLEGVMANRSDHARPNLNGLAGHGPSGKAMRGRAAGSIRAGGQRPARQGGYEAAARSRSSKHRRWILANGGVHAKP